jgi:putative endopeptidase
MASVLDNYLGEALGELYVKVFLRGLKKNVTLVNNLQKAYAKRIDNLEWMSPTTKEERKVIYHH